MCMISRETVAWIGAIMAGFGLFPGGLLCALLATDGVWAPLIVSASIAGTGVLLLLWAGIATVVIRGREYRKKVKGLETWVDSLRSSSTHLDGRLGLLSGVPEKLEQLDNRVGRRASFGILLGFMGKKPTLSEEVDGLLTRVYDLENKRPKKAAKKKATKKKK